MVIGSRFWTASHSGKVPAVELAGKAGKLGLFVEKLGHNLVGESFLLQDDKTTACGSQVTISESFSLERISII